MTTVHALALRDPQNHGLDAATSRAIDRRQDALSAEAFDGIDDVACQWVHDCVADQQFADVIGAAICYDVSRSDANNERLQLAVERLRDSYVQAHRHLYRRATEDLVLDPDRSNDE